MRRATLTSSHPQLAQTLLHIGLIYSASNERARSLTIFQLVLKVQTVSLPLTHPDLKLTQEEIDRLVV